MYVGEPLLLVGNCNNWGINEAKAQHGLQPVEFGSTEDSQESAVQVRTPRGGLEFQLISASLLWKWRIHPVSSRQRRLQRDVPEAVPCSLSEGADSEDAHDLNFFVTELPGQLVDVRVLLSTRFGICVWYSRSIVGLTTQEAPTRLASRVANQRPESPPVPLKRTADRVGGFTAYKEKNAPKAMNAFQRGGTPMGGRKKDSPLGGHRKDSPKPKHRSKPGAFSQAVSTGGTGDARALRPRMSRPPKRVRTLSLEETKELLEALRRVCSHQSFRRALDDLRRRGLGAFQKREAMAKLLALSWKEQLRQSGFSIDEHTFPQMLEAVRSHRDSAGVEIVSRELERLLGFPAGALFAPSSWKGRERTMEVTLRHVVDGDELRVVVPESATVLEVRQALVAKLQQPEMLEDCDIACRTSTGELQAMFNSQPLNNRRSLVVSGRSIALAKAAPSSRDEAVGFAGTEAQDNEAEATLQKADEEEARQSVEAAHVAKAQAPQGTTIGVGVATTAQGWAAVDALQAVEAAVDTRDAAAKVSVPRAQVTEEATAVAAAREEAAVAKRPAAKTQAVEKASADERKADAVGKAAVAPRVRPDSASKNAGLQAFSATRSYTVDGSEPEHVWLVVGGSGNGGIIVREGFDLKSTELLRLHKGARVRELERLGNRLHYEKLQGVGPQSGWVNVMLNEKTLMRLLF